MKAAIYHAYGPPEVVRVAEVRKPSPGRGEILVRICASTVSAADWRARSLIVPRGFGPFIRLAFGIFGPRQPILGSELSGIVESVGAGVTRFKPGDEVVAFLGAKFGCHAEYRVVPASANIIIKPANLNFEEAAAMSFGGMTALYYLRTLGKIAPGESVLVIGASGAVGSAAVQLATHCGTTVTGICSGTNADMVRALGAQHIIDYTREDLFAHGRAYDIVFDAVGEMSFSRGKHLLKPRGRMMLLASDLIQMLSMLGTRPEGKRVIAGPAKERLADLAYLKDLAEAGKYRPVIGHTFPLDGIVEAHRLVDTGHKKGNIAVRIGSNQ